MDNNETPNSLNLDLNLGPLDPPLSILELVSGPFPDGPMNLDDWINVRMNHLRGVVRQRTRHQRVRTLWRSARIPPETRNADPDLMVNSNIGGGNDRPERLQRGEGSVMAEERDVEEVKTSENNTNEVEDEDLGKKEDIKKGNGDEGSFFDCNICLDLARDPVVTCCGHLFCWPCIYRWLNVNSDPKECPVCKGEVTVKNVTPIYGQGNNTCEPDEDSSLKIPCRPQAQRIESWRQTIEGDAFSIPMEEIVRRLGSRFYQRPDIARAQTQNAEITRNSPERSNSLLNRILTSRGMRREHNTGVTADDAVDLTQTIANDSEVGEGRRLTSRLLRRSYSHRAATISNLTSALSSAERIVESYFRSNPVERNDDRDSMSSIAAAINSESQTVDTAIEIDSTVSVSTASSRRRNDASRLSDMESGNSRAPRRRRLN